MSGHDCLTQEEVRAFGCPVCDAPAGEVCVEDTGAPRASNHRERVQRAKRARVERAQARREKVRG